MGSVSARARKDASPDLPKPCQSARIIHKLVTLAESKMTACFGIWIHSTRHKLETSDVFYCLKKWWPEGIPFYYGQFSITPDLSENFNQAPNSCRAGCAARQLGKTLQVCWQCYSNPCTLAASKALVTACKRAQRKLSVQNRHS